MAMRCLLLSVLASAAGAFVAPSASSVAGRSTMIAASYIRMPEEDPDGPAQPAKPPKPPPLLPTVEGASGGQLDVISRLLKDRILLLGTDVNDEMANVLVAQLLYLANEDPEKDITLYINSPGGSVSAGLAIYDTMQFVRPPVATLCVGQACSMGSLLLAAGAPGMRRALPNSRVMIHQPSGGVSGQATDIEIHAREILATRERLVGLYAAHSGRTVEEIASAKERDHFMSPEQAREFGLIDEVVSTRDGPTSAPAEAPAAMEAVG